MKPPSSKSGDKADSKSGDKADERAERRRELLEQAAQTVGRSWADQRRHDLQLEGRAAAGGWPGTLREARIRVEHHLQDELARRTIAEVTGAERELLVRRAYASARAEWSLRAEPEDF